MLLQTPLLPAYIRQATILQSQRLFKDLVGQTQRYLECMYSLRKRNVACKEQTRCATSRHRHLSNTVTYCMHMPIPTCGGTSALGSTGAGRSSACGLCAGLNLRRAWPRFGPGNCPEPCPETRRARPWVLKSGVTMAEGRADAGCACCC